MLTLCRRRARAQIFASYYCLLCSQLACSDRAPASEERESASEDQPNEAQDEPDPEDATGDDATDLASDTGRSTPGRDAALDAALGLRDGGDDEPELADGARTDTGTLTSDSGRLDAGPDGAEGGRTADGGPSDAQPAADRELCQLEGREVAILGDSYIDLTGEFTEFLQAHARAAGALDADDVYVDRALSGASMGEGIGSLLFPTIPTQLPSAIAESRQRGGSGIKVVIMDGGGNDVLVNNRACLELMSVTEVEQSPECVATVEAAIEAGRAIFNQAASEGVKAVIYFFYPHLPEAALLPLAGPYANNTLDYAYPLVKALCDEQTQVPCYFVDTRPAFDDPENPGWPREGLIDIDGVHPTSEGSQLLADEVWKVMQRECIGVE